MKRADRVVLSVGLAMLLGSGPGCYRYTWQALGGPPGLSQVPVDEHNPRSSTRWSFVWGLLKDKWTPADCAGGPPGASCASPIQMCAGKPIARVDTSFGIGSALMMVLTLGMAVPEHVTIYCSTEGGISTSPDRAPPPLGDAP